MQFDKFLCLCIRSIASYFFILSILRLRIFHCGVAKVSQSVYVNMQQVRRSEDTLSQEKFQLYALKITSQAAFGCHFYLKCYLVCGVGL